MLVFFIVFADEIGNHKDMLTERWSNCKNKPQLKSNHIFVINHTKSLLIGLTTNSNKKKTGFNS